MSEKVVLDIFCSLNPEQRYILACTGYAIWTWYHAFLTAFPHSLLSESCLALLSVILIVVLALTFSSLLLERSLEGVLAEPRFEFYGGKKKIQIERSIVFFLLLSWDDCSCHSSGSAVIYIVVNLKLSNNLPFLFLCYFSGFFFFWPGDQVVWGFLPLSNSVTPLKRQKESALRHDKVL